MADPGIYLEKLSLFSRFLRDEGLIISPGETADAAKILTELGFQDREQVKTALRTVYAKSRTDQLAFDRVFDAFFITEEEMRRQAEEHIRREAEKEQARREAEDALSGSELGGLAGAPQPGPGGLSTKGRAASPDSDRRQPHHKARQLRQRHGHSHRRSSYFRSLVADFSPKYEPGQSCRKIKRKEPRYRTTLLKLLCANHIDVRCLSNML
jgi:uncharacterized protein with von Willebrand factor type A (vWA) domain